MNFWDSSGARVPVTAASNSTGAPEYGHMYYTFPLPTWSARHIVLISLLYSGLFLVGLCGNVSVITLIRHVHAAVPYDNTMIFILFLCCVDLASVIPLPMAIVDQLLGFWMFGTVSCKIFRTLEHVGRALSTFVLAAMAFDRFQRVCYPHRRTSRSTIFLFLILLTMATFVLLSPMVVNSTAQEIPLAEIRLERPLRIVRVQISKCVDSMEGDLFTAFTLYMFLLGFAIPVFLIVLFYALLVRRLFARSRTIPSSQLPVNRIALYTMAISIFFVVCWSPFWISTLYGLYMSKNANHQSSTTFVYMMYGIHALPYVNSASNWLLYGLLNSQLMRRAHIQTMAISKTEETRNQLINSNYVSANEKALADDGTTIQLRNTDSLL